MKKIEILVNTYSWMFLKANKVKSDKTYRGKIKLVQKLPLNILIKNMLNFLILLASRDYISKTMIHMYNTQFHYNITIAKDHNFV